MADTITIDAVALNAVREFVRSNIAYAKYKVGSTYYRAEIIEKELLADGRISITFLIDHTVAGNITVTEVQLFNHSDVRWAYKAVSITRRDAQEGILYRCRFTVTQPTA